MTLPNQKIETVIATLRFISEKYGIQPHLMAKDAIRPNGDAVSADYMYKILSPKWNQKPLPDGPVDKALRSLLAKLKLKYPEDCPTKIIGK